jgi:hypothetical protein
VALKRKANKMQRGDIKKNSTCGKTKKGYLASLKHYWDKPHINFVPPLPKENKNKWPFLGGATF